MRYGNKRNPGKDAKKKVKASKILLIASLCLCLFVFGPHYQSTDSISVNPKMVQAQTAGGDTQDSTSSESDSDDTPSADDIADFTSEFDKDGDGEVDEPEDEPEDDVADQDEADEADQDDDADDSDESDDQDRENQYDDDDDGEETQDDEDDMAHSGKNRDDIDGDATPEFRLSGYDRYRTEGNLRRLGTREELTPLIAREENMLLEN